MTLATGVAGPAKEFDIWNSEKSFRYKEEALFNHAPQVPGIYQIVTFDEAQNPKVVYMDLTQGDTIFNALDAHWRGAKQPAAQDLLAKYPNLYFSFIVQSNAKTPEDQQDLFWALAQQDKPELQDLSQIKHSGRYSEITVKDRSIL
jgi:hypothetical protein